MTDRKLMQLAQPEQPIQTATYTCGVCGVSMQMEQTEQEPVAHCEAGPEHCPVCLKELSSAQQKPAAKVELMTSGGNAGIATRIVEIDDPTRERLRPGQKLYTAPPQRKPWVEASEKEVRNLIPPADVWKYEVGHDEAIKLIRSALNLAKEKNT